MSFLSHILSCLPGRKQAAPLPEPGRVQTRPPASAQAKPLTPPPAADPALTVVGARRPLVSVQGHLAGFEFQLGAAQQERLLARADASTGAAHANALLAAMRLCVAQGLRALTELPLAWLARSVDANEQADAVLAGMVLLIRPGAPMSSSEQALTLLARLRAAGALVGWRQQYGQALAELGRPDFIVPQLAEAGSDAARRQAISRCLLQNGALPQLLLDLPDVDALEALLNQPSVMLASCRLDAAPHTGAAADLSHALPPQATALMQLLGRLVRDDDVALLAADIKADAALSVRLLQHLNSAGASPGRVLDSIEHAVMVLGRDALYRWTSRLLVRLAPPRPAGQALQAHALARARLLEALARATGEAEAGALYLLGLASSLPRLLGCQAAAAVAMLQLPPQAKQAMLEGCGPWAAYLDLAHALDAGVPSEQLATLAAPFGGAEAVQLLAAQAWE